MFTPPRPAPIILAHGLFGFQRIGVGPWTWLAYFKGIPRLLEQRGHRVYAPSVHPTGGISRRSQRLGQLIDARFPGQPVHLVAHSMGGLDARQLLTDDRWQEGRILSLITVGSPHLGSSLAEMAKRRLDPFYRLLRTAGWDHQGVLDILPDRALKWHEATPRPDSIPCYSVAGHPNEEQLSWPLILPHRSLERTEGPNDGLVSVKSALGFGTPLARPAIDHLQQMNWFSGHPQLGVEERVNDLYRHLLSVIDRHDPAFQAVDPPLVASTSP